MFKTEFIVPNVIQTRTGTVSFTMTIEAINEKYALMLRDEVYETINRFEHLVKPLVNITSDDVRHDVD